MPHRSLTLPGGQAVLPVLIVLLSVEAMAAAKPSRLFGSDMVLQRDRPVPIWGSANPGEEVVVTFNGQKLKTRAAVDGRWMVTLAPMEACVTGNVLTVGKRTKLTNVVVGDVWLCSGQSNMEQRLQQVRDGKKEAGTANHPLIRFAGLAHKTGSEPQRAVAVRWQVCAPKSASRFSAVGYFFGRKLQAELKVPIGLVLSAWSGTRIEAWTPLEGFLMVPELKAIACMVDSCHPATDAGQANAKKFMEDVRNWISLAEKAIEAKRVLPELPRHSTLASSLRSPTAVYNGMIHPLIPFAVRGAIWYQGESNGDDGMAYFHKQRALIGGWRKAWKRDDLPFYFVQLASYQAPTDSPAGGDGWAEIREAQRKCLEVPNTGMAVTIDIGNVKNIHPWNKQDVGLRLALLALAGTYGRKDLTCSGPLYKAHTVEDGRIRIEFDSTGGGLMVGQKKGTAPAAEVAGGALKRFAIAGEDKVWHWAEAVIDGTTVLVSSPKVPKPVAVRYAYSMNPKGCNLYNREGLPASPFRTDDWAP